jgi:Icc-related predicted phosphoesterase
MGKVKITLLSDTHSKHKHIPMDHFIGGDILIHSGDISSMGYEHEVLQFLKWFESIPNYTHKVFIAGNHDWMFQKDPNQIERILKNFPTITYLRDSQAVIEGLVIYGSPWQPEFFNWAFNLPRKGDELEYVWSKVPDNTDILITHGPAYGYVDRVIGKYEHLGCELLIERINQVKPSLHVCGHIHSGNGVMGYGVTTFINASVLDERYDYTYKPYNILLDTETKQIEIL